MYQRLAIYYLFIFFAIFSALKLNALNPNAYLANPLALAEEMRIESAHKDFAANLMSILQRKSSADFLLLLVVFVILHYTILTKKRTIVHSHRYGIVAYHIYIATMLPQKKPEDH